MTIPYEGEMLQFVCVIIFETLIAQKCC